MEDNMCRSCADCGVTNCNSMDGTYPSFCLTTAQMKQEVLDEAMELYNDPKNREAMIHAANIEAEFYGKMTRVEETMEFAKRMGFHKIGIATCVGLIRETRTLAKILRAHGFEVFAVGCKAGAIDKTEVGIDASCRAVGANMCNPIHQALRLNEEGTDYNIIMGLCVGHDSLFIKYSKALTTTLVAKDRVLGHNPVAALYTAESYYKKLL